MKQKDSGFSVIELIIILSIAILLTGIGIYIYKKHASPKITSVNPGSSSYSVSGNKILDSSGKQYIPLGVTVFGISKTGWQDNIAGDLDQINASSSYWKANIVRIQVSPYYLNNNTPGYLDGIKKEVSTAETDNLNVIISAQYENTKNLYPLAAPDSSTENFWNTLSPIYAHDSHVWFDLFNEPTADKPYSIWKNGGTVNSKNYTGMQTLVNDIRKIAPNNIIVAESIDDFQHLEGIKNYTLSGGNIIYSVHPYFSNVTTPTTETSSWWQQHVWAPSWGSFAGQLPIIIGEWGEHEGPDSQCQPNAPDLVPGFLSYISTLHLGLIGWSLTPGAMIRGNNLENPNKFDPGTIYDCTKANTGDNSQGAGADILQYFSEGGRYSN
jgi:hypothetical protein